MKAYLIMIAEIEVPDDREEAAEYIQNLSTLPDGVSQRKVGAIQAIDEHQASDLEIVQAFMHMVNESHDLLSMEVSANASDSIVRKH